ncbi:MAG: HupE/UreJ family protein [Luteibaculaceae bacterium]
MFTTYLALGFDHILDINGFDHILYVLAICAAFPPKQWKNILIMITAFTLGHSITLALAAFNLVVPPSEIIEFLIPCTILITAIFNLFTVEPKASKTSLKLNYPAAAFFGLIHGFGFSNFFRSLVGKSESVVNPLLAFNLGVELGQILIVLVFFIITFALQNLLKIKFQSIKIFISGVTIGISLLLIKDAIYW